MSEHIEIEEKENRRCGERQNNEGSKKNGSRNGT